MAHSACKNYGIVRIFPGLQRVMQRVSSSSGMKAKVLDPRQPCFEEQCTGIKSSTLVLPGGTGMSAKSALANDKVFSYAHLPKKDLQPPGYTFQHVDHNVQNQQGRLAELLLGEVSQAKVDVPEPSSANVSERATQFSLHNCSQAMKNQFADLFPDRRLDEDELRIMNIAQHTVTDQSAWSQEVEKERDELLQQFVTSAQQICASLQEAGYWADFIDPSSGTPYFGAHTNTTLFETDERYRLFGYDVVDLGCCKVLSHHIWNTHVFVGTLFTTAPEECTILHELMKEEA